MEDFFKNLDLSELEQSPLVEEEENKPKEEEKSSSGEEESKINSELENLETKNNPTSSEEDTPDPEESSTENTSPFVTLAKALMEEGVSLTEEEIKEIKDAKSLVNVLKDTITKSEYDGLSEQQKKYLDALRAGVPEEDIKQALKVEDVLTNKITPTIVENDPNIQEQLLYQYYLSKNIGEEEAKELVSVKKEKLGENFKTVAMEAYSSLKDNASKLLQEKIDKQKEEAKKVEEEQKKKLEELKDKIKQKEEIIPGVKLTDSLKDKIFEVMTTPTKVLDNGVKLNAIDELRHSKWEEVEPILAYLYVQTEGFKNLKNLKTPLRNSAIEDLEKSVKESGAMYNGSPKKITSKSTKDLISVLDNLF